MKCTFACDRDRVHGGVWCQLWLLYTQRWVKAEALNGPEIRRLCRDVMMPLWMGDGFTTSREVVVA